MPEIKKMWEYQISAVYFVEKDKEDAMDRFKIFQVFSDIPPDKNGWNIVFNALMIRGDFDRMKRVENCSCFPKEMLVLL